MRPFPDALAVLLIGAGVMGAPIGNNHSNSVSALSTRDSTASKDVKADPTVVVTASTPAPDSSATPASADFSSDAHAHPGSGPGTPAQPPKGGSLSGPAVVSPSTPGMPASMISAPAIMAPGSRRGPIDTVVIPEGTPEAGQAVPGAPGSRVLTPITPGTLPVAPPAIQGLPGSPIGAIIQNVALPLTTVYTPNVPAGFVQVVRTVRTIRQGSRVIVTTAVTRYKRPYQPLPRSWIEIPFMGLKMRLVEGVSQRAMASGIGHFPGMALPGEIGNCALAAHSNVPGCDYFRMLHRLRPGDRIYLHTGGREYEYRVANLHLVWPSEVADLRPTSYRRLTLVTCALPDARRRLIVVAVGPPGPPYQGVPTLEASRTILPSTGQKH